MKEEAVNSLNCVNVDLTMELEALQSGLPCTSYQEMNGYGTYPFSIIIGMFGIGTGIGHFILISSFLPITDFIPESGQIKKIEDGF